MKKIFIVSDVHGCYLELIKALEAAGFDETNPNHLLISNGDAFDRGPNSLLVYQYLTKLEKQNKAIIIRGNHTKFFYDYLTNRDNYPFNYLYNGTNETLADFMHETSPFESWCVLNNKELNYYNFYEWLEYARKIIRDEFPELVKWLEERPVYVETNNYIITHGAIDTSVMDWKNPSTVRGNLYGWDALNFDDGRFFGKDIKFTDKTIIIGHFGTNALRHLYNLIDSNKDDYSILKRKDNKIIAIDATTIKSNQVNVLVIEDDVIEVGYKK